MTLRNSYFSPSLNPVPLQPMRSERRFAVSQAVDGGYLRYRSADVTVSGFTTDDTARMFHVKSSDRIHQLVLSTDSSFTLNIGLYDQGSLHDGPAVATTLFANGSAYASASQGEALTAGFVTDEERGSPLWQMLGLASDPIVSYDVVIARALSTGNGRMLLEMFFTKEGS